MWREKGDFCGKSMNFFAGKNTVDFRSKTSLDIRHVQAGPDGVSYIGSRLYKVVSETNYKVSEKNVNTRKQRISLGR